MTRKRKGSRDQAPDEDMFTYSVEETNGFVEGLWFAVLALHLTGVDLKWTELTALLTDMVTGERTMLPSASEVPRDDVLAVQMTTTQRKQWEKLHRMCAALMLKTFKLK